MNLNQDVSLDFLSKGIDPGTARILYYQNKGYLISAVVIFTCILLILFLIVPQIQNVLSIKAQEEEYRQKIAVLKDNIAFLNNLNETELTSQTKLVAKALPPEKDFVSILYVLSTVAESSGVALGDFAFEVGDLSPSASQGGSYPSVEVSISLRGDVAGVKRFLTTLAKRLPLSEVVTISGNSSNVTMLIDFYYRSFPSLAFQDDVRIPVQSKADKELLKTLEAWQPSAGPAFSASPPASPSASRRSGPFY